MKTNMALIDYVKGGEESKKILKLRYEQEKIEGENFEKWLVRNGHVNEGAVKYYNSYRNRIRNGEAYLEEKGRNLGVSLMKFFSKLKSLLKSALL